MNTPERQAKSNSHTLQSSERRTPPKKVRRRVDGSPATPLDKSRPTKTIYFIRHGQSLGQAAKRNGLNRKTDPSLRDCCVTPKGESEALHVRKLLSEEDYEAIQMVVSSPLTRAMQTALLAFPTKPLTVHFDLREIGSRIPENLPRDMDSVLKTLEPILVDRSPSFPLDVETMQPSDWPRDYSPNVIKKDRIRKALNWLYEELEEDVIAVVCHYNVIRSAVINGQQLRPQNAVPIRCLLYAGGDCCTSEDC